MALAAPSSAGTSRLRSRSFAPGAGPAALARKTCNTISAELERDFVCALSATDSRFEARSKRDAECAPNAVRNRG